MKIHSIPFVAVTIVCACAASPALGDPLLITGGSLQFPAFGPRSPSPPYGFGLLGEDTRLYGVTFDRFASSERIGSVVRFSRTVSLTSRYFGPFEETLEGVHFSDVELIGLLTLTAEPVVVSSGDRIFEFPFTMTGMVSIFERFGSAEPLLTRALIGQGVGRIGAGEEIEPGVVRIGGAFLDFRPAPLSPTPEPATLVLVAGGLAALWRRRHSRRSTHVGGV